MSKYAQSCKYITFCDADDMYLNEALAIMFDAAERNHADCVASQICKVFHNIKIKNRGVLPVFSQGERSFNHDEIMKELYISCFGITNYPVSLCAKLYQRNLITNAINKEPIVKFMGDDLSITLDLLPATEKLTVLPNVTYLYRMGGGTSRYIPDMMNDFISLYRYKVSLIDKYSLNSDFRKYLDIELMNILISDFTMSLNRKQSDAADFAKEVLLKDVNNECVQTAAKNLVEMGVKNETAYYVVKKDYDALILQVQQARKKGRFKSVIRKILLAFS